MVPSELKTHQENTKDMRASNPVGGALQRAGYITPSFFALGVFHHPLSYRAVGPEESPSP